MISLALAALFFGFFAGWSIKSEKQCNDSVIVEHLDRDIEFIKDGQLSLTEIKALKAMDKDD